MSASLAEIATELYDQLLTCNPARVREVLASPTPELREALKGVLKAFEVADAVVAETAVAKVDDWPSPASDHLLPELQGLPPSAVAYGRLVDVFEADEESDFKAWYVFQHSICAVPRAEPHKLECVFASATEITCAGRTNTCFFVHFHSNASMACLQLNGNVLEVDHVIQLGSEFPVLALSSNENFDSDILHAVVTRVGSAVVFAQTFRYNTERRRYLPDPFVYRGNEESDGRLYGVGLHKAMPKDIKLVNGGSCIIFKGSGSSTLHSPVYSLFQARCIGGVYSLTKELKLGATKNTKFAVRGNRLIVVNNSECARYCLNFS
jgi:hypothetical protein